VPGVGENKKCKLGTNKGTERPDTQENSTAVCQSLLLVFLEQVIWL